MKKTLKKFLAFIMAVCIVGGMTTAYAATDASAYFDFLRTFDCEDFPAMMDHDTRWYYKTPITFLGLAGYYYYANVEVYAGKDGGSSTRTYMTNIVQARN